MYTYALPLSSPSLSSLADPASLYPFASEEITSQWWAVNRAWGDMYMGCNVRRAAGYMASFGNDKAYACVPAPPYTSEYTFTK